MKNSKGYNKYYLYGIAIILLAGLVTMRLPYQDKSIVHIVIPVIKFEHSTLYLSGLIPLGLAIWSSHMFVKSGRFKSRFIVAVVLLVFILPLISKGLNLLKSPIYMMSSGVKGIELTEHNLNIYGENGNIVMVFEAEATSYIDEYEDVLIFVELPEVLREMIEEDTVLVREIERLDKGRQYKIEYTGTLSLSKGYYQDDLFDSEFYREDYSVILKDNAHNVIINVNDGMF